MKAIEREKHKREENIINEERDERRRENRKPSEIKTRRSRGKGGRNRKEKSRSYSQDGKKRNRSRSCEEKIWKRGPRENIGQSSEKDQEAETKRVQPIRIIQLTANSDSTAHANSRKSFVRLSMIQR